MGLLEQPVEVGSMRLRNRLYRAPVLEGAGTAKDPVEAYAKAFVPNAEAGIGMIVQGNTIVTAEGRTSPGMTTATSREEVLRLAPMVDAVHAAGAAIVLQLGHGGLWSIEAWHEPFASRRTGPLLVPSPLRFPLRLAFTGVPVHAMTTVEVHELCSRFGDAAAWAREAGYDAVQLASANAKLLDQFLSPFYNRRTDEFGGSLEGRARILRVIRERIAERAGADYPVLVKVPAEVDLSLPLVGTRAGRLLGDHLRATDAVRLAVLAEEWGFASVTPVEVSVFPDTTLTRGGDPSNLWTNKALSARLRKAAPNRFRRTMVLAGARFGRAAPFQPVWNRSLFAEVRRHVSIPVLAVGGIRTRAEAEGVLAAGEADLIGVGRPFYLEPDLPRRFLAQETARARCENSNWCVSAQMLGLKGGCYNPVLRRGAVEEETAGS